MKRKFTFLIAAAVMLLTMMATTGTMWGQTRDDISITFSEQGYENGESLDGISIELDDDITIQFDKATGSNGPAYYNTGSAARLYSKNTLTITPATGCTITGMTLTFSGTSNTGTLGASTGTYSLSSATGTWTGSSTDAIVITNNASSGHARIQVLSVTYSSGGTPTCGAPSFSPEGGNYLDGETLQVEISSLTENATILYSTTSDEGPWTNYTNELDISSNTTIWAYASKDGMNNSTVTSATYTFVEPMTVAEALASSPNDGVFVQGIISQIDEVNTQYHNATYWISDDGTTTEQMKVYRGRYLDNTDFTSEGQILVGDAVVVTGNLTAFNEVNQLAQGNYLISLIRPEKVATPTFTPAAGTYNEAQNVTVTCATEEASIFYKLTENGDWTAYTAAIPVATTTTIWAKATKEGMVDSDVASAAYVINTEPTITVDPATVNAPYTGADGTLTVTYENITEILAEVWFCNAEGTAGATYDWITADINAQNNVAYLVEENDGAARTAYFKVYALDDESNDVYSNLVTVTQAAYIVDYATLPFEYEGGVLDDFSELTGTSYSLNDEGSYAQSNAPYRIKFTKTDDYLQVKCNEQPGIVTIGVKVFNTGNNSKITVQGSADGETFNDIQELTISASSTGTQSLETTESFGETHRYVRLKFTKGVNVGVGPITIAKVNNTPSITLEQYTYNLNANGGDAVLDVTYTNMPNDPQAEVWFCNAEGTETVSYNWITADINAQNNVAGHIDANTGAARSAYFKVKGIDANDNAVYSDLVTINQAAYVLSIEFETASIDLAAGGESDRKLSFEYSGLGNDPEFSVNRYESDGTTPATYDWLTTEITDGNKVSITVTANTGAARKAYFKVYGSGSVASTESNLVTVNQAAQGANVTYTLATTIIPGRHYIIVGLDGDDAYAMGTQNPNNRAGVGITINGLIATVTSEQDVCEFVLSGDANNKYTIYDENKPGFLYAASSSSNYLKTETNLDANGNGLWSIVIDESATITAQGNYTRKLMRFNPNNGNPIFACYAVSNNPTGSAPHLYMKDNDTDPVYYSPTKVTVNNPNTNTNPITVQNNEILVLSGDLSNCTNSANLIIEDGGQVIVNNAGVQATFKKSVSHSPSKDAANWYTISSPVNSIAPASVTNLIQASTDDYDLYLYDEATSKWLNQKKAANSALFTNLTNGRGYLYWNNSGAELSFPGELNGSAVEIDLTKTGTGTLAGFNLIGNPFAHDIYKGTGGAIDNNKLSEGYYTITNESTWSAKIGYSTPIKAGQGILVQATEDFPLTIANTNTTATAKDNNHEFIEFIVANNIYEDVTYALFEEGIGLNKINHNNDQAPMIYISQNGGNYAIATMSDNTQTFDLNFKAMTTGQYTLSMKADGKYDYIHVIDRFTGEDIDMLLEGKYSFISSMHDNEARFIVKLNANANIGEFDTSDIFAYQNGSDIIVNGDGELQVYDATGRMVMNTRINGVQTVNVSSNGLYIFRLVGDTLRTQKIVVE